MNKTQKITISFFFLLIVSVGLYYFFKSDNKNMTSELFIVKDTADIAKIIISQDSGKVILTRNKKLHHWTVDNKYPGNKKAIKKLYQTLTEVRISKPVLHSKKDSLIKNIQNNGKKIEIYNSDNQLIKKIMVGSFQKQLEGTYLYNPKEKSIFIVNIPGLENDLNYRYNINPVYWLKPEIFSYRPNDIKEIVLNYPEKPSKSFKLKILKDTAYLYLLSNNVPVKNLNLLKVGSYLSYFMNVKFASETTDTEKLRNKLLNKIPYAEIRVTDINQHTKNIKLFQIINESESGKFDLNKLHALINDKDVVIVKYVDFDLILKDIYYFVN
ncbi:MAG: hypothetical protein DRI94_04375 [Bacteroidetes bacterium]|nr:MAG: hypothetical protein DRI94_04375 [Bacteroidota bacterium]